jgi:hypothetical protein
MSDDAFSKLILELAALPKETEWVEFKVNNDKPDEIGEYISALSNSAALLGKPTAYIVWGIDDDTHEVKGTDFRPRSQKGKGNEELENWLRRLLTPRVDFRIHEGEVGGKRVAVFEIPAALTCPVQFEQRRFIRIGSYKKPLLDHLDKERALWRKLLENEPDPRKPRLHLEVTATQPKENLVHHYSEDIPLKMILRNSGGKTAKAIKIALILPKAGYVMLKNMDLGMKDISHLYGDNQQGFQANLDDDIHPGVGASWAHLKISIHKVMLKDHPDMPVMEWAIMAEDMDTQEGQATIASLGLDLRYAP